MSLMFPVQLGVTHVHFSSFYITDSIEMIKITDKLSLTQIFVTQGFRFYNKIMKIRSIGL
jgi:hypothetical protein